MNNLVIKSEDVPYFAIFFLLIMCVGAVVANIPNIHGVACDTVYDRYVDKLEFRECVAMHRDGRELKDIKDHHRSLGFDNFKTNQNVDQE